MMYKEASLVLRAHQDTHTMENPSIDEEGNRCEICERLFEALHEAIQTEGDDPRNAHGACMCPHEVLSGHMGGCPAAE